jgi:hypothetical protein
MTGMPDFQNPLSASDLVAYAPFGNGGYAVLPREIVVARNPDGLPKFHLRLMRRVGDLSPAGQYGVMDISLAGDFPVEDALAAARAVVPDATVSGVSIHSGFARLYPTNDAVSLPAEMTAPVALGWAGADFARWTMRLPLTAAQLIQGALLDNSLLFGARVEFDVVGVSPRIPVFVQFEPAKLVAALTKDTPGGQLPASELLSAFTAPAGGLPFVVVGTISDPGLFAQVMTDRVIAAYGSLAPAPDIAAPPYIALQPATQLDTSIVQWDFSQPVAATRQWAMLLDPLTALRTAARDKGLDALVKEIAIPPLALGFVDIDFEANLPPKRMGVPAIGVNVQIPPNPPQRPAAQSTTVMFVPPNDKGTASLRLGPTEPPNYAVSTFAMVATARSAQRYDNPKREMDQPWVQLQPNDFPLTFAHITAADRLLAVASIHGSLAYTIAGNRLEQPFTVTAAEPEVAIAAPSAAGDATLSFAADPVDGSASLVLPPMTIRSTIRVQLDFTSFPEHGPHKVSIECSMNPADPPLFIEFTPDEKVADPTAIPAKFVFTPQQPNNLWGYVAQSPFRSGYRFRVAVAGSEKPQSWSDVLSPAAVLQLDAKGGLVLAGGPATATLATSAV